MNPKQKKLNIVIVGEGNVGKTCLMIRYLEGRFPDGPDAYIPVQYECNSVNIAVGPITYKLTIADLYGKYTSEHFNRIRPIFYLEKDVIVACFAVDSKSSYDGLLNTIWKTEIQRFAQKVPIILVGTKTDLHRAVSLEEAEELKEIMKAALYIECSSKEDFNIELIFSSSVTVFTEHLKEKKKSCSVL